MDERESRERIRMLSNELDKLARAHTDSLSFETAIELRLVALFNVAIRDLLELTERVNPGALSVALIATHFRHFPIEAWIEGELEERAKRQ